MAPKNAQNGRPNILSSDEVADDISHSEELQRQEIGPEGTGELGEGEEPETTLAGW